VTTAYEYGVERISASEKIGWSTLKTDYVYDGRGSVAQELTYNSSWYTFGGFLSNKGVNRYTYTPFGEMLTGEGSGYRFNGEYYDSATGMVNLRARQFEPGVMRFSQRDIWHGMIEMPTSQNRYLYCVNEPIGYYDRGGHRFDEGSGVPQKIKTSTPVKDVEEIVPSFGDSAQELRREQLALQKIKTANRQLENTLASAGIDINNTDDYTRKIVEDAQKEIAEKAAGGTLTASERDRIIQTICTSQSREELTPLQQAYVDMSKTVVGFFDKIQDDILDFGKNAIKWIVLDGVEPMMHDLKEATSEDNGTFSIGLSGFVSPVGVFDYNGIMMITFDNKGYIAYQTAYAGGVGAVTPSASGSILVNFSNAPTYKELEGPGYQIGASVYDGIGVGAEFNIYEQPEESEVDYYYGGTVLFGLGTPGAEGHVEWGQTFTRDVINIYDEADKFFEQMEGW